MKGRTFEVIKSACVGGMMSESWLTMIVGAIIGIVLSYILWLITKAKTRVYSRMGDSLLVDTEGRPAADKLQINFDGHAVPRVTSTSYGIWNGGNTTIDGKSISAVDPLRLVLEGEGEILQVTMEEQTRYGNDADIILANPKYADLKFEYLEKGDGFRVNVIHTARPGELKQLGEIKGLPQGVQPHNPDTGIFSAMTAMRVASVLMVTFLAAQIGEIIYGVVKTGDYGTALIILGGVLAFAALCVASILFSIKVDSRTASNRVRGIPSAISNDRSLMRRWPERLS